MHRLYFTGIRSTHTLRITSRISVRRCRWQDQKEVRKVKRVKAACILQTLIFQQKEDLGLRRESILDMNRSEVARYKQSLERTHTRYRIDSEEELEDGSILVRVRKQYNEKADVSEYFS